MIVNNFSKSGLKRFIFSPMPTYSKHDKCMDKFLLNVVKIGQELGAHGADIGQAFVQKWLK